MASFAVLDIFIFAISLGLMLGVSVPLTGTLVRFRANYNPKGLALDAEGGAQPYTGPVVNSYFAMLIRIYRIEGWQGLYKGLMPTVVTSSVITLFLVLVVDSPSPTRPHGYNAPDAGIFVTFFYSIFYTFISLPAMIITYRSIITPYRLSWFNAPHSLRVLLTPTERSRPWTIYLTPGLLSSQLAHIAYVVFALNFMGRVLVPWSYFNDDETYTPTLGRTIAYLLLIVVSTLVLTPLEVISTRLAIQRNHALAEYNSVSQEVDGDESIAEFYGEEDVIGLRSERDPYLGLVHCVKSIIEEEGYRALYRGWWITLLGGFAKG